MSLYKLLLNLPAIGTVLSITNSYAYSGDKRSNDEFAGLVRYIKAFSLELLFSVGLTAMSIWPSLKYYIQCRTLMVLELTEFALKPGELIISTLPSLLGFGIGVYALMFAISPKFVRLLESSINDLRDKGKKNEGSSLSINSSLAYPLMVLLITLSMGAIQRIYSSEELLIITWISFWYSIIVLLGMIGVLYELGAHSLIEKKDEIIHQDNFKNK